MENKKPASVDEYIALFPKETQLFLKQLRVIIKKAAPNANEVISYQMPAYKLNGPIAYFAGYKHHIGFYPTSSGIQAFAHELSGYTWSKGTIQFPLDEPLPVALITKIIKYRVEVCSAKLKRPKTYTAKSKKKV